MIGAVLEPDCFAECPSVLVKDGARVPGRPEFHCISCRALKLSQLIAQPNNNRRENSLARASRDRGVPRWPAASILLFQTIKFLAIVSTADC